MRLLDVHQLKVTEFVNEKQRPPYAILSHTWGHDEVSFQDLQTSAATPMTGYSKIKRCCELAIQDGFKYVWIDTCCIDKTSSSELSEAINSMYHWYKSATVCYVYLSDVKTGDDPSDPESPFTKSRWFTRGWTLQELLAPRIVTFHNCDWAEIGTKFSLQDDISRITGIPCEALSTGLLDEISVAQRMSWAAKRETTRVEDIAYCLMGIFSVNMPTLYGEGRRAFIRLQHEIMKSSNDHSLFAWASTWKIPDFEACDLTWDNTKDSVVLEQLIAKDQGAESGLLATSPSQFIYSGGVQRLEEAGPGHPHPYSMTNQGLHIRLPMVQIRIANQLIYQATLSCEIPDGHGPLCIYLKRNPYGQHSRILTSIVRTALNMEDDNVEVDNEEDDPEPIDLYIKEVYPEESASSPLPLQLRHFYGVTFQLVENPSSEGYKVLRCGPARCWNQSMHTIRLATDPKLMSKTSSDISYILVRAKNDHTAQVLVILGVQYSRFKSKFFCAIYSDKSEMEEAWRVFDEDGNPKIDYFDKIIKDVNPDRITRQLASGHTISIAIRPGPGTPDYRVMIAFKPPFNYQSNLSYPNHVKSNRIARPVLCDYFFALPKLTIYLVAGPEIVAFYPKQTWSTLPVRDDGQTLVWNSTGRHMSGFLGFFTSEDLFLLIFRVVRADIAIELITAPSNLGPPSTWDDELLSYLNEPDPLRWSRSCRLLSEFPQEGLKMDGYIKAAAKPRVFLHEVGYQMVVNVEKETYWSDQRRRYMQMVLQDRASWGQVSRRSGNQGWIGEDTDDHDSD